MKQFELRFLDLSNAVVCVRAFNGRDDLTALSEAERLCATYALEVWDGNRKVARVKQGNAPLTAQDRVCG